MAVPETGTGGVVGSWQTLQPGIPQAIADIAEAINSFAQAMITILNILLTILGVIKAFLIGFTNPLIAIINAIISLIESLLQDLRQLGLYIAGDFELEAPHDNILGGYAAYERRMLARFVDRRDPTRPNFSSSTAAIAIFLYASADNSQIFVLTELIRKILLFFGQEKSPRNFTAPVGLEIKYGQDTDDLSAFQTNISDLPETPNAASISWQMAPPPGGGQIAFPLPAPKGFLVEVSTVRDGLIIAANGPVRNHERMDSGQLTRRTNIMVGPDRRPFYLHGGYDALDDSMKSDYNRLVGIIRSNDSGPVVIYGFRDANDNVPVPLNMLRGQVSGGTFVPSTIGNQYILQRTFYVKGGSKASLSGPGQGFNFTLNYEDMPYNAEFTQNAETGEVTIVPEDEPATTVYVRISAVTKNVEPEVASEPGWGSNFKFAYDTGQIKAELEANKVLQLGIADPLNSSDRSAPSDPLTLTFPGTSTEQYLAAVQTALVVVLLARADLPVTDRPGNDVAAGNTGLEDLGKFVIPKMLGITPAKFFKKEGLDPTKFRERVRRKSAALTNSLYQATGALGTSLEDIAIDLGQVLLDFKWKAAGYDNIDLTILESLDSGDTTKGLALNPASIGGTVQWNKQMFKLSGGMARRPGFFLTRGSESLYGAGSADASPCIYGSGQVGILTGVGGAFCRNVILEYNDGELLKAAANVLNIAAGPLTVSNKGGWIAIRLLPQGIPPVEQAMGEILNWLRSITFGVSGIIALILAYIEFIETRLLEIQSIIERINNLLQSLLAFQMPQMAGLIITANGTDGLLQGLLTAENKPTDSGAGELIPPVIPREEGQPRSVGVYGAGAVIVAGGLPEPLFELLKLFFPTVE